MNNVVWEKGRREKALEAVWTEWKSLVTVVYKMRTAVSLTVTGRHTFRFSGWQESGTKGEHPVRVAFNEGAPGVLFKI